MSYCSIQDLENYYLGRTFKCGDYLSNGKAEAFIADDAAYIDSVLKVRYSLPITATNDLKLLKMINAKLVVGTIDDIFREKTQDGKFDRGRNTRKEAMDMLTGIQEGTIILDGTAKDSILKFNNINSDGDEVVKRFKDSNIEPLGFPPRPLPGNHT